MGKRYTYGYKDSHSEMKIPKYSPTWQAWRAGNTKPKSYFDCPFYWVLTIEYFDIIEEAETANVFKKMFSYKQRDYAVNTRDLMTTNLMLAGKTIKSTSIVLTRV